MLFISAKKHRQAHSMLFYSLDQACYCLIVGADMPECSLPFYIVHSTHFDSLDHACHLSLLLLLD
jgi:hypothetical protein